MNEKSNGNSQIRFFGSCHYSFHSFFNYPWFGPGSFARYRNQPALRKLWRLTSIDNGGFDWHNSRRSRKTVPIEQDAPIINYSFSFGDLRDSGEQYPFCLRSHSPPNIQSSCCYPGGSHRL